MLAVESGLATLILTDAILTEFRDKLTDKFAVPKSEVDSIVERWAACGASFDRREGRLGAGRSR